MQLASELHRVQARKGTNLPYISHLLGVTSLVLEDGGSEDEAIAALLHDAVEDQGGKVTLLLIQERFGPDVARIVEACSDTDVVPKPPWRERKEAYVAHLATAPPEVIRVSLADKLHNARAIIRDLRVHGPSLWERFNPDADQVWYYDVLARAFREAGCTSPMLDELDEAVAEMKRLSG